MSKLVLFVSATFVLFFAHSASFASPQNQVPDSHEQDESNRWPTQPPTDDLSIAQPPHLTEMPPPATVRYYPYQQALTFRVGEAENLGSGGKPQYLIGFQYLFPKFLAPKLEAGADLHTGGTGHIFAGARWIAMQRSYFRPSMKLSLDHMTDSNENLASLIHLDNYYLRATATFEYTVWNPFSLRLEAEGLVGTKNNFAELTLGISRAW